MLEFNQDHKGADLSTIESKIKKAKFAGKVLFCGVMISSVLLFKGCDNKAVSDKQNTNEINMSTAIIMENGNALVVDLKSYQKYSEYMGSNSLSTTASDQAWVLHTISGDRIVVDINSVKFVEGENTHEKASMIAKSLISEDGSITFYDDAKGYDKSM